MQEKPPGCTTVFCGNLAFDIDEQALREVMEPCGEVKNIRLATDRETGRFKGFGHVEFFDTESTEKAVALGGTKVMGRILRVDYAMVRAAEAIDYRR
ncbi:hypothetical protein GUITHDRAFT_75377 [Guillardia theta CCMP2712]|uniref:RRM domain-containing protein n=1 Tax=Guillardia theta (strain CCMP2712) TaxID=905079 RepID=L1IWV2_GUITC|nr:hypothetical protein GUITHDRAFT_75377 [Guillardia theta CCMP2712]EKX40748.1 hypothetical protein GUITHDRAFT_75377 [Guillardia theta CCMP2712]|eukprot:XP_005827728.1 hypothetical protein GUITHDRAFT_75377 [Guillardia theta CCMP2712]